MRRGARRSRRTSFHPMRFDNLGYDMAAGKSGTGWMKANESDVKEALAKIKWTKDMTDEEVQQVFDEYAQELHETGQWNYEVGSKLPKLTEDNMDDYCEKESLWDIGYSGRMIEIYKKMKKEGKL